MPDTNNTPSTNQYPVPSNEPTAQIALHDVTALERGIINKLAAGKLYSTELRIKTNHGYVVLILFSDTRDALKMKTLATQSLN